MEMVPAANERRQGDLHDIRAGIEPGLLPADIWAFFGKL
jgi:hypothetical protein